ncbi:MAG TPA: SBBP repeat-containing protein, partial [Bacteroidia bacterium]|nr:SBBP repeat-containing protein [Bacteroidia bacterium]
MTNGGALIWSTYYGGSGDDRGFFCQLDTLGNIYLAGPTSSSNSISTIGSHQPSYGGGSYDGFLVKFNTNGVRQWATYYGGSGEDAPQSCAVDFKNNPYLTGYTKSTNSISTISSHQVGYGGMQDVFLAKFNPSGVRQWATYYGGSKNDLATNVTCDSLGNTYITGWTGSVDSISTLGSHQPIYGGCDPITGCYGDAFVTKFDSTGVRQWGTY